MKNNIYTSRKPHINAANERCYKNHIVKKKRLYDLVKESTYLKTYWR